ncbi:MAG: anti-anti-sigma regulatory factor [Candidatus Azotimanducaceae bacterium]|jgi:anti-anti-sigma regulatory factor
MSSLSTPSSPTVAVDVSRAVDLLLEMVAGKEMLYMQGCIGVDNVSEYRDRIIDLLLEKPDLVELDLSRADTNGSSMIALLVAIQRFAKSRGRQVIFVDPQPKILEMSEMTGLRDILFFKTR